VPPTFSSVKVLPVGVESSAFWDGPGMFGEAKGWLRSGDWPVWVLSQMEEGHGTLGPCPQMRSQQQPVALADGVMSSETVCATCWDHSGHEALHAQGRKAGGRVDLWRSVIGSSTRFYFHMFMWALHPSISSTGHIHIVTQHPEGHRDEWSMSEDCFLVHRKCCNFRRMSINMSCPVLMLWNSRLVGVG
jgi:hypothetical protein